MTDINFDERLQAMKARYLENFPKNENDQIAQLKAFKAMTSEQKTATVRQSLQLLQEKQSLLQEKLSFSTNDAEKADLQKTLQTLVDKISHFEDKQAMLKMNETDPLKYEKLKRQLAQLELKRAKSLLENKDCNKIDRKIAEKKEACKKFKA